MMGFDCLCKRLARLVRDNAGNTLAIAAAALIPLMALIGGGVDVSRAYMAKTQLQSACDAGVLAGRRAMSKSGEYGDSEKAKASSMFNFNFNGDALDVKNVSYITSSNDDGQVLGTATAVLPTLIMKIFDKDKVDLSVDCMAELQIGNVDVMFVLDTTGSMDDPISWGEPKKIDGLRDAVKDFHKTINQAVNDNRTRIRYGFVPYSMTVNASELISDGDMPTSYFAGTTGYQSRLAEFHNKVETPTTVDLGTTYETYGSEISQNDCYSYGNNQYPSWGQNPQKTEAPAGTFTSKEYDYYSWQYTRRVSSGGWWWGGGTNVGWCKRRVWTSRTTYETEYAFSGWDYRQTDIDTSGYRGLGPVTYASSLNSNSKVKEYGDYTPVELAKMKADGEAENIGTSTSTWNGCLEERATEEPSWSYDFDPIPSDALDLNLTLKPEDGNPDTKWKPMWRDLEYTYGYSGWSHPSSACPAPMKLFTEVTLSDDVNDVPDWLNTYLTNLKPEGNTYHDLGMIWGGRLTSATGIFADNVTKDADKINVSKHIIFMTDGIMQPTSTGYSAYGVETYDHRIAPSGSENTISARHTARFNAVCEAIKAQGTTIWVIAFGTSMTNSLRDCASDGRAYYSKNTDELRNTFKFIAAQVADLRLGA